MTLYPSEDIIGKNCRFLQGKYSDQNEISRLSKAIKDGIDVNIELINYRKDGKPFWNRFHVFPLRDSNNTITNYVAVQQDITHIRQRAKDPRDWTSTDVTDWLKFMRVSEDSVTKFENSRVDGRQLLTLSGDKFDVLGVTEKEREIITNYTNYLKNTNVPALHSKVSVKAYFEGEARILRVNPTITLKALTKKIDKSLQIRNLPTVLLYENTEKEKLAFVNTKELTQQLLQARLRGESFKVWVDFFDLYYIQ